MAELEDELGDIIAKARIGTGLTVDQLATLTGMSGRFIEKVERYQETPSEDQIRLLAENLKLDPGKLADIALNDWEPLSVDLPDQDLIVESLFVPYGAFGENCYVLASRQTSLAAVVDPGGSDDKIVDVLRRRNLRLDLVLVTHAHGDHVSGLPGLQTLQPTLRVSSTRHECRSLPLSSTVIIENIEDNATISFGNLNIVALTTPGHTSGSACYYVEGVCFVGDTLFAGSIGRPANKEIYKPMLTAIRNKILSLPDDTIILPGHGPATTVAQEKAHNPFF